MSVTIKKAMNLLRSQGVGGAARKAMQHTLGTLCAKRKLARKPTFADLDALLDFSFNTCHRVIRPIQVRSEIRELLARVQALRPRRVMEIGTANGGTLFLFTRVAAPDAKLLSLDLPGGEFGGGYPLWKRPMYQAFALDGQSIELLQDDSHEQRSLEAVKHSLGGEPIDFLLLDGDHTYDGIKRDFAMYGPLVRSGGLIAFHDIAPRQVDPLNKVRPFWNELKAKWRCEELLETADQQWAGIGLLHVDEPVAAERASSISE